MLETTILVGSNGKGIITMPTLSIAELKNITKPVNNIIAMVIKDKVMSIWQWNSTSIEQADDVNIIKANAVEIGRWYILSSTLGGDIVTQLDAENGTSTLVKMWNSLRVAQSATAVFNRLIKPVLDIFTKGGGYSIGGEYAYFVLPDFLFNIKFQYIYTGVPPNVLTYLALPISYTTNARVVVCSTGSQILGGITDGFVGANLYNNSYIVAGNSSRAYYWGTSFFSMGI